MALLETYEGIPEQYETKKKFTCHGAYHAVRIQSHRKFCVLKELSKRVGWNYSEVVEKLEKERKTRSNSWYKQKKATTNLLEQAKKDVLANNKDNIKALNEQLAKFGY